MQANGMYPADYYPATAGPALYPNDPAAGLLSAVISQINYYFSIDNLLKDTYLRKHMDSQGFVLLTVVADFKRLKSMTDQLELVKYACQQSTQIEHRIGSDGVDRVRAAEKWEQWVLPKEDRDTSAQHDGPEALHQPPRPNLPFFEQSHIMRHSSLPVPQSAGPVMGGQGFQSLNSFAAPYNYDPSTTSQGTETPSFSQFQSSPTSMNSSQTIARSSNTSFGSSPPQIGFFSNPVEETEPDTFTDVEVDALKVVLRDIPGEGGSSSRAPSSRTFSNGSAEGPNGNHAGTQSPPPETAATSNE